MEREWRPVASLKLDGIQVESLMEEVEVGWEWAGGGLGVGWGWHCITLYRISGPISNESGRSIPAAESGARNAVAEFGRKSMAIIRTVISEKKRQRETTRETFLPPGEAVGSAICGRLDRYLFPGGPGGGDEVRLDGGGAARV